MSAGFGRSDARDVIVEIWEESLGQHNFGQHGRLDVTAKPSFFRDGPAQHQRVEEALNLPRVARACRPSIAAKYAR